MTQACPRLTLFCSRLRVQLKLDHFRIRNVKGDLTVTSDSGNQWVIGYYDLSKWDWGTLIEVWGW
jgi:hypothetical protein